MKLLIKFYLILDFIAFYLIKLIQSNLFMAYDILTPKKYGKPAILKVPLQVKSDAGMLLFSNLVSMTPGTLSLDISEDRKILLVHVLYFTSDEEMQKDFNAMQQKILKITK